MVILGVSAFYHDSAAVLVKDGMVLCAMEEERLTRIKHDNQFPLRAIAWCLEYAGIPTRDVDAVAYYEKPLLKFERIIEIFVRTYPFSLKPFLEGLPEWLSDKIQVERHFRKKLGLCRDIFFVPHHLSHAAASFYPSPFKEAAVLTVDGVGEYETTVLWRGQGKELVPLKTIHFPDSLGLLYSTFTAFLGFRVNDDEYKVMGLAAYGRPVFADAIRSIVTIADDGSFRLHQKYFSFQEGFQMWSPAFEALFGAPRKEGVEVSERDKNLAASIQQVTEEIYFTMLNHLYALTGCESVCIGGGVALNALANGKIYERTPFKKVFIFGPAGDSGGAVGAALFVHQTLGGGRKEKPVSDLLLGSLYDTASIQACLEKHSLAYRVFSNGEDLAIETARLLAENNIVGWFQGRGEFGPRALGARSILANPQPMNMKEKVNTIKRREQFRPFAGSILRERVQDYFKIPGRERDFPFMNFCFQVKEEKRGQLQAIVHEDGTCRVQTVTEHDGIYCRLIKEFQALTGIPCILNTSLNLKGEPVVENPEQAITDFLHTKMDYLVVGDFLVKKQELP